MKLPRMTAWVGGGSAGGWGMPRGTFVRAGVTPAITGAERDQAQQFINNNCHNLQPCNGGEGCATLRGRGQLANQCTWARFRVRDYYVERGIPDPGNHQGAIVWDDGVAQACLVAANANNCP